MDENVDYRKASLYDVNMTFQRQPEPARFDYPGRSRNNWGYHAYLLEGLERLANVAM